VTTTPAPVRLRAVTREVRPADDALDGFDPHGFAWLHHGTRLVTSGVTARVAPADAAAVLAAVDADDAMRLPGSGAIAVGALPFDPDTTGALAVPGRVNGLHDGRAWVTEIGPGEQEVRVRGVLSHDPHGPPGRKIPRDAPPRGAGMGVDPGTPRDRRRGHIQLQFLGPVGRIHVQLELL